MKLVAVISKRLQCRAYVKAIVSHHREATRALSGKTLKITSQVIYIQWYDCFPKPICL